jgi:hypothetical protein
MTNELSDAEVEWRAYSVALKRCGRSGQTFDYRTFDDFLKRVGRRPSGRFKSGVSQYALMKKNDAGEYEWRATSSRKLGRGSSRRSTGEGGDER